MTNAKKESYKVLTKMTKMVHMTEESYGILAAPKTKTSKKKTRSRFAHWAGKPNRMVCKTVEKVVIPRLQRYVDENKEYNLNYNDHAPEVNPSEATIVDSQKQVLNSSKIDLPLDQKPEVTPFGVTSEEEVKE